MFKDNGRLVGFAPVWKSRLERPFSAGDLKCFRSAVPLITHGLVMAQALTPQETSVDKTEPTGTQFGVITADFKGRILAIDQQARALFLQPAVFDGRPVDAFATSNLREGLRYVSQVVSHTFAAFNSVEPQMAVASARVWWHATGVVFLLKAVLGQRLSRSPLVTILVEERQVTAVKHHTAGIKNRHESERKRNLSTGE